MRPGTVFDAWLQDLIASRRLAGPPWSKSAVGPGRAVPRLASLLADRSRLMHDCDAIVIGAGHNGLAAAIVLAKAGWKVIVVERNQAPGGAVRSGEITLPGFRHDLFATNLNLFAGSPFRQEFRTELEAHGLRFASSDKPFGSVFPQGRFLGVRTDLDETCADLEKHAAEDGRAWRAMQGDFARMAPHLFPLLGLPCPSWAMARSLLTGMRRLGRGWPAELARLLVQSPREYVDERFHSPMAKSLVAAWGMHLDFPPDAAGGALFPFLESMVAQSSGMVLGKGGASVMIEAMESLLRALGGELRCAAPAARILLRQGEAVGVELESGEKLSAGRAVIANLAPPVLEALTADGLTPGFRQRISRYRFGPGTMMIHLALSAPPDWKAGREVQRFAYVHIAPWLDDMALSFQRAAAGLLPESPMLVVGQPTAVDPSRAPEGGHILWIQVRVVPSRIKGDALDRIGDTDWPQAKEPFADRVIQKLDRYAPGLAKRILARTVLSPDDLEARNPNLVGGDNIGGSHRLAQNFLFRPFPGWSRYRTPVRRLYMCGASTWPGAGVGAGSGFLLGRMLTR